MGENLVQQGYFEAESFFQYTPTKEGLKQSSPLAGKSEGNVYVFQKKDVLGNIFDETIELDAQLFPAETVYEYLMNYYCLYGMNLENIKSLIEGGSFQVFDEPYSFIKQATIYDKPNSSYYIVMLDKGDKVVCKEYKIGINGFIQFYRSKIFGIYPKTIVEEYLESGNSIFSTEETPAPSKMRRVEIIVTTTDFDLETQVLNPPALDATAFSEEEYEEVVLETLPENKKRAFIDTVRLINDGISDMITAPDITFVIEGIPKTIVKKKR